MNDQRNSSKWLVLIVAWATFALYGAIAAPVPGVNEPHYLCKAKHFWQPDWCQKDFFLSSPNAHTVFYVTVGALTQVFTLDQSAWIARALASLVLAWGWVKGLSPLFCTTWAPLWCAWVFLAMASCGNFSGEWLVGGVEGKVFSYGLLLAAFGDFQQRRYVRAAVWSGVAVSFHPVVGLWGLLAFFASQVTMIAVAGRKARRETLQKANSTVGNPNTDSDHATTTLSSQVKMLATNALRYGFIIFLFGLPGLLPVFQLLTEKVPPDTKYAGNYLQVYFRLAHHLDPMIFSRNAYWGYAFLLIVFLIGFTWGGRSNARKAFDSVVVWAVIFAIAGVLIGYGPRPAHLMPYFAQRMVLLKFYPFRLGDVLLPLAVAVSVIAILERTLLNSSPLKTGFPSRVPLFFLVLLLIGTLLRANSISEHNRYSKEDRWEWLDVCDWIDRNLPADALVQSPTNGWAFKWFARRAEYVAFKDCPQDAAGIVEWNRRLNFLQKWYEDKYADNFYSRSELKGLRDQTGLTHLLTDRLGPLDLKPIYRNDTFQVYDLTELDQ